MGCAIATIKYVLFIFNVFLALSGILLIAIGVITNSKANSFKEVMAGNLSLPSMLLIGVGVVIFVIAFFGCCGAIQESHCMMSTYAIFLLTAIFIEVGICGVAYFYKSNAQEYLAKTVDQVFDQYYTNEDAKNAVDAIQRQLRCCGSSGPSSWTKSIPSSCCIGDNTVNRSYESCPGGEMWTDGCVSKLTEVVKYQLSRMSFIALIVAIIEYDRTEVKGQYENEVLSEDTPPADNYKRRV